MNQRGPSARRHRGATGRVPDMCEPLKGKRQDESSQEERTARRRDGLNESESRSVNPF